MPHPEPYEISSKLFVAVCGVAAVSILIAGAFSAPPVWLLAAEIFATIVALFAFGSFRLRIHKNALTYGMSLVIVATFFWIWWPTSQLCGDIGVEGWLAAVAFVRRHLLSWHGIDQLIHADTMLFILGLTLFVAVIAQTRLLESLVFALLRRNGGSAVATTIAVTALAAVASGILDGVSMIGLTIRTLVVVMFLANAPLASVRYSVMVCTVVTTVCGMWLAYGEPPNLIMKANLRAPTGEPYLSDAFFLRYCLPGAIASYVVIAWNLRRRFHGEQIDMKGLDVLDANVGALRFLQAARHGKVLTAIELLEDHEEEIGEELSERVQGRVQRGEPLGAAMIREAVPRQTRLRLLGEFVSEQLAEPLDGHYTAQAADGNAAQRLKREITRGLAELSPRQTRAQRFGIAALIVFVSLLVTHAIDHRLPLFVASFAGFFIALGGIVEIPEMRRLALHEAHHEYAEYYFLFPLFLSITLLTKAGFFAQLQGQLLAAVETLGNGHVAFVQFAAATVLSALLDNNVVADIGSRALQGMELSLMHLFAMAQIAGYAVGGCWTHIGSAQSVVAYAFVRRDIDDDYTPLEWMREMTPLILQIVMVLTILIYIEGALLSYLG